MEKTITRPTGEEELKNKIDDIVDDCIEWEESWDGEEESAHKSLDKPSFKDQIFNLIQEQLSLAREEEKTRFDKELKIADDRWKMNEHYREELEERLVEEDSLTNQSNDEHASSRKK